MTRRFLFLPSLLAGCGLLLAACGQGDIARDAAEEARVNPPARLVIQDRYVIRPSARGFDATVAAVLEALDRRDLTVFAVIDHAAAAQTVDATLAPTTVVIFGNPAAGTPLIREVPVLGAELPLRALIYERDGNVSVALTGIANLARTYPLAAQQSVLDEVERTLNEIASEVTKP